MWELIWLMVIMKIPILYLCWVVYWAVKAEPRPEEPATVVADASGLGVTGSPLCVGSSHSRETAHARGSRSGTISKDSEECFTFC